MSRYAFCNTTTFPLRLSTPPNHVSTFTSLFRANTPRIPGVWRVGHKDEKFDSSRVLRHKVAFESRAKEYMDVLQENGLPLVKWHETRENDIQSESIEVSTTKGIKEHVESIKSMLASMDDGRINVSAHDTAWVALVQDLNGSRAPQFPSSLEWIANNQLPDGSWGDSSIFLAHDRLINTLACIITLRSWSIHPEKILKGISFIQENICKLEDESDIHMPIGFEVAFPSLIEKARTLGIAVPDDSEVLQDIYARRSLKLTKIPRDILHRVPSSLLYTLEGMTDLEWKKLLKLQCPNGSFMFSPSSTAFALMQTKDDNCLRYLKGVIQKFNGGAPTTYPVDLFERIWSVDQLQRLGISRHFQSEIKECMAYVHRHWTDQGISWARNSLVQDVDDTAMGFRLLRLHGYQVSPGVFRKFENGGEFVCFVGQSTQSVSGMYNLFRASQVLYPGEKILDDAKKFSYKFLRDKEAKKEILDKWIITKDLVGEVEYALNLPWYASLPRLEARFFLEQYGGEDDVWIGKTLYRMPYVNNNMYLELAKLDYNSCLATHQLEWKAMQQWYKDFSIEHLESNQSSLLCSYYLAAASIFEPERSIERIAWAKTMHLVETIRAYFTRDESTLEQRRAFANEFRRTSRFSKTGSGLPGILIGTLNQLSWDVLVSHGNDIYQHLCQAWEMWLMTWQEGGEMAQGEAELVVQTINLCAGRWASEREQLCSHPQYQLLSHVTNKVCCQLRRFKSTKVNKSAEYIGTNVDIESNMQELVQLVLGDSSESLDRDVRQSFLTVAKTFYYYAYCDTETINAHISKVLFQNVI